MFIRFSVKQSVRTLLPWKAMAIVASLGLASGVPAAEAKVLELENLFVFGDSFSDAGNSGLLTTSPQLPSGFPPPPYVGGRATNGPVAVEQLWSLYNPASPPLKPSLAGGTNYAVISATSGQDNQFSVDNTPEVQPLKPLFQNTSGYSQLQTFLNPAKTFQPSKTLFVYWLGASDGLYWLSTQTAPGIGSTPGTITGDPPSAGKTLDQLIDNTISNAEIGLQTLINQGATNVLVPNVLDLSKSPLYNNDPVKAALVHELVTKYNTKLATLIAGLKTANPQVDLMPFDTYGLFNRIMSQPSEYDLTNVSDRCVTNLNTCNPEEWLFWNATNPTTKAHSLIAREMFQQVPGPLPLAGAATAFGWSRQLRRRLSAAGAQAPEPGRVAV